MIKAFPTRPTKKPSEEGFMLLAVILLLALMMIALAVAAPRIAADIQRDREVETMHRGLQYRRAIQLYYRKFNRYPPNMEALEKTNNIRFLRKKYIDPTTGKEEWKPIMLGQNKTPMAMGFFGQPLGGLGSGVVGGLGPSGGNGLTGASSGGGGLFSNSGGGSIFGSNNSGSSTNGTDNGSDSGGTDANGNPINGGTPPAFGGQTFGGAGIIGVSPTSPKQSILVYKKKNHYNEWEFLYSPLSDRLGLPGQGNPGTPSPPGVGAPGLPIQPAGGAGGIQPTGGAGGVQNAPTPTPTPTPQQ